jgi:large subunit ribosomal protein L21
MSKNALMIGATCTANYTSEIYMTYAIIETGGKQLCVEPGRFYDIELLPVEEDEKHTISKVLLVNHEGDITVGRPFIEGAEVEGTVLQHGRGKKILVYKMKPKKKTRKKRGHRQNYTRFMINEIRVNGNVLAAAETPVENPTEATPVEVEAVAE